MGSTSVLSSMSVPCTTAVLRPHRGTRSLRPSFPVISATSSRKARKIGRGITLVGIEDVPCSEYRAINGGFGVPIIHGGIGSRGSDAVISSGGGGDGDDVPPSCGGGGGGGEEDGNNTGGGDGEHVLVQILTKPKLENDPLGLSAAFKSFLMLTDYIMKVLRLLISSPEGAVFSVGGVVIKEKSVSSLSV